MWRIPTAPFDLVNSYAFTDPDGSVTLVDCGLRQAPARIVAGLAAIGKAPQDVQRIVLTHAHTDHAGGAADLLRRTGATLALHEQDAGYARAGRTPPRDPAVGTFGRLVQRIPDGGFAPLEVGEELRDEQVIQAGGGLRVVHTPGHTPGHVSLLHEPSGVLVTGDAVFNMLRGRLRWPTAAFCTDVRLTHRTAQRLADLSFTTVAFTHGPHIAERARETLRGFLSSNG